MDGAERRELFSRLGELRVEIVRIEEQLGLEDRPLAGEPLPAEQAAAYALVAAHASDFLSIHAANGDYLFASPSSEALFGWKPAQLRGKNAYVFFHPADLERVASDHAGHVDGAPGKIRYRLRRPDGSYRWVETRSHAHHGADGLEQIICITRDIDEEVQGERKNLLHGVVAALAHEVNNPLTAATMCLSELDDGGPSSRMMREALQEIGNFVRDVESFVTAEGRVGWFDVAQQFRVAAAELPQPGHLEVEGGPGRVYADEVLLRHLVRSLTHAFARRGRVEIGSEPGKVRLTLTGPAARGRALVDLAAAVRGSGPRISAAIELAELTAAELGASWQREALANDGVRIEVAFDVDPPEA